MIARRSLFRAFPAVTLLLCAALAWAGPEALKPAEIRARFHTLLDRPRVPLSPTVSAETADGFVVERGKFESEAGQAVPFLSMKPVDAKGRLPAVIVLHGTGGSKQGMAGTLKDLAGRGMLALAIDARYHGDRVPGGAHGAQEYQAAILRAWREKDSRRQEHPFYYDTVYDLWRTVDYLQSRPDVDGKRIGMIGFSMGGIQVWLAAASDERVRAAVPAIGVQSLRWSLENGQWQGRAHTIQHVHDVAAMELGQPEVNAAVCRALWTKIVPGILDDFDCPNMLRAIAPRPLLVLNGEKDPNCPLPGAKLAFAAAEAAYRDRGVTDRLKIDVAPGIGHAVTPEQRQTAYSWLERWLKQ